MSHLEAFARSDVTAQKNAELSVVLGADRDAHFAWMDERVVVPLIRVDQNCNQGENQFAC